MVSEVLASIVAALPDPRTPFNRYNTIIRANHLCQIMVIVNNFLPYSHLSSPLPAYTLKNHHIFIQWYSIRHHSLTSQNKRQLPTVEFHLIFLFCCINIIMMKGKCIKLDSSYTNHLSHHLVLHDLMFLRCSTT